MAISVEAELTGVVRSQLGVPCSTRVPDPIPPQYVQLRRQGGSADLLSGNLATMARDKPLIDVYVYAEDEDACEALASQVRTLFLNLPLSNSLSEPCYSVSEELGPTWFDDNLDGVYLGSRLWLSYRISVRFRS